MLCTTWFPAPGSHETGELDCPSQVTAPGNPGEGALGRCGTLLATAEIFQPTYHSVGVGIGGYTDSASGASTAYDSADVGVDIRLRSRTRSADQQHSSVGRLCGDYGGTAVAVGTDTEDWSVGQEGHEHLHEHPDEGAAAGSGGGGGQLWGVYAWWHRRGRRRQRQWRRLRRQWRLVQSRGVYSGTDTAAGDDGSGGGGQLCCGVHLVARTWWPAMTVVAAALNCGVHMAAQTWPLATKRTAMLISAPLTMGRS